MRLSDLRGKQVVLFGLGREGRATRDVLAKHGIVHVETDDSAPNAALVVDANTVVIKSPGIPPHNATLRQMVAAGAVVTSSTNLFFAERKGRGTLIAVTGTKGKSTTSALLAHVLAHAGMPVKLVGNIGAPSIAELDAADDTIFVIEISSYQLSDLTTAPDIGVILNLYEEHMDWHGSVDAYQAAKLRMGEIMGPTDTLVYNAQFSQLVDLAQRAVAKTVPFAADDAVLDELKVKGVHNRDNARAVLAVCDLLGVDRGVVGAAFATFVPLPHRMEEIVAGDNVFVNDSISTTPQSALAAIDVYADRLGVIVLGGQDRGYDFCDLAMRLKGIPGVLALVMPGGDRVFAALNDVGVAAERVQDLREVIAKAREHLASGQVCLLSPASPSYGQFKNFEDRGEQFRAAVQGVL